VSGTGRGCGAVFMMTLMLSVAIFAGSSCVYFFLQEVGTKPTAGNFAPAVLLLFAGAVWSVACAVFGISRRP
jgi:hypothetical protein